MPVWLQLVPAISSLLDRLIPDPAERQKEMDNLAALAQQADAAQLQVDQAEAQNPNLFVAGWRPFIGWICGVAFAYHYVAAPFTMFLISCYRGICAEPVFDMGTLETVLMGMLGLGGLRTIEKIQGASK